MPPVARRTLVSPGSIKGFASARSSMAIPEGFVCLLNDVRLDDGTVRVRWGGVAINGTISGAYSLRGAFECVQNGTPTLFWAGRLAGKTILAKSIDAGVTWTTVTPSSGTYGDTRFDSEGWVYFALVSEGGTDYLVAQNGADDPRVYSGSSMAVSGSPSLIPNATVSATFNSSSDFTGTVTTPSSGGGLTTAQKSTATGTYVEVSVGTGVASTDRAYYSKAAGIVAVTGLPGQFAFLVDEEDGRWRNLKIEASLSAGTGGPWYVVYDPPTSAIVQERAVGTTVLIGAATLANVPAGTILSLRFTYLGDPPSSAFKIKLHLLASAGYLAGGTNYAVAYGSSGSRATGSGRILPVTPQVANGIDVPVSPLFGYVYSIDSTTPASLPGYIDRLYYYRNDYGTSGYYYIDADPVAPSSVENFQDGGAEPDIPVDYTKPLPRGDAVSLPKGRPMASVNGRLFVGSGNRLYYSEAGRPFSFAETVQFDENNQPVADSAGSFSKPGETFNAIVAVGRVTTSGDTQGSPLNGAVAVYPVTDRKTYVLSGFDAASLNKTTPICVGSRSPFSIGVGSGCFYMLDSERQVRKVQGAESIALSKRVVDDLTLAIPDSLLGMTWGCYHDGRYRLAYAEPDQTQNTRILVYNESMGFESVDRPFAPPPSALVAYYDGSLSRVRILGFGSTSVAELEVPGAETDAANAPISARIVFPELTGASKESGTFGLTWGAAWFVSDVDETGSLSVSVLGTQGKRSGTVPYPSVTLTARESGDTRVFATTGTGKGGDSGTVQVTATFQAKGGKRLYRLEMDAHPSGETAQR